MLPTPESSFWLSRAALMASLRPRKSAANSSAVTVSGSAPAALKPGAAAQVAELQPPKAARVHKAQLPAAGQAQPRVGVGRERSIGSGDQQIVRSCPDAQSIGRLARQQSSIQSTSGPSSQTMCFPVR